MGSVTASPTNSAANKAQEGSSSAQQTVLHRQPMAALAAGAAQDLRYGCHDVTRRLTTPNCATPTSHQHHPLLQRSSCEYGGVDGKEFVFCWRGQAAASSHTIASQLQTYEEQCTRKSTKCEHSK